MVPTGTGRRGREEEMKPRNVLKRVRPSWYEPHRENRTAVGLVAAKTMMFMLGLLMIPGIAAAAVPVADFSANSTSGPAPLAVRFSQEITGSYTGVAWYFGDEQVDGTWSVRNASSGWSGRYGHTSVALPDGSIVLMGGYDYTNFLNDTWRSTDKGAHWTRLNASSGWPGRQSLNSVVLPDGSIVLMGGYDGIYYNDTWRSVDKGVTWTEMNASSGWIARNRLSTVALPDGSIVLTGGYYHDTTDHDLNDTWRSTDKGAHWTLMNASSGWSARDSPSIVVLPDSSIVLMGGNFKHDTWRSTDKGAHWTLVNASPGWSGRYGQSSVVLPDGSIVLTGGHSSDALNDTWRSTDKGAHWTQLPDAGWPARYYHCSVVLPDGSIVVTGARDEYTYALNDTWRLQTAGIFGIDEPEHTYTGPGRYPVTLQAYNAEGYNSTQKSAYITVTGDMSDVGVYRQSANQFILRPADYPSSPAVKIGWGKYSTDLPVTGDWDGDNITDVGVYRPSANQFILRPADYPSSPAVKIGWGKYSSDLPVTGTWS